ncbi:MAG: ImmA/IrrE family metallo-endopeptidase [Georgenia sp.]
MDRILEVARSRGVRVTWRDLGRRNGECHPSGLIILNPRRTEQAQRVTLAHELGHAHYGHVWTDDPHEHAKHERLADEHAAALLIPICAYRRAETTVGNHPGALAKELGVTRALVEAWQTKTRWPLVLSA